MKNFFVVVFCLSFFLGNVYGQHTEAVDTTVHYAVDKKPAFPGGHDAMMRFIGTYIRYPKEAKIRGIAGKVYASFVVEPDGSLSHIKILKGLGYGCDAEVKRIFASMPKWKPGLVDGKPVRAYTTQVVAFRLETGEEPVYTRVDSLPVFAVGKQGVEHFLLSQLWYPKRTVKRKVVDTVYVSFVVEKDNRITHLRLKTPKSVKDWNIYDYEALRVVSLLPVAHPAILNHKPVRVKLYVPVVFDHKNVDMEGGRYKTVEYNFHSYTYFVPKNHLPVILPPAEPMATQAPGIGTSEPDTANAFAVVEKMPEFPGGMAALMRYLAGHIHYPAEALKKGCSGRVFAQFIVEPDGSVTHVRIIKGICPSLDKEAVSVIENMPKWIPGYQKGKAVRVRFNLPVKFSHN